MNDIIRLIQRQVSIDDPVTFMLNNGKEVSGILAEIGRSHVVIENEKKSITLMPNMIGSWEVKKELPEQATIAPIEIKNQDEDKSDFQTNAYDEKSSSVKNDDTKAFKKVLEIEARFKAQIQAAKIEIKAPNFIFPDNEINEQQQQVKTRVALSHSRNKNKYDVIHSARNAKTVWQSAKGKYDTAYERNELSVRYGRVRLILNDFQDMNESFPWSASVERHLAYFYWLSGNKDKALQHYKNVAPLSLHQDDWFNVAVLALQTQEELACYALDKFFQKVSIADETVNTWYIYVRLIRQFRDYIAVRKLLEVSSIRNLTENEEAILFETGIYLLKEENKEQLAINLLQKQESQSLNPLTVEIFRQFTEQPLDSFLQLKSQMDSARVEKKMPPKPPVSTKSSTLSRTPQYALRSKQVYNNPPPLPSGSNPFACAERAKLEKDLSKAVKLYRRAIKQKDHFESAVKNLASVLAQLDRVEDAIEVLQQYRDEIDNQKSIDNMLVNFI
ncbi:Cold-shock protein, DNA-binding [Beggiatoa sp. PS]|nr:Cold-shock protein, DNA-binding [Beggiatoa sp. PS]